MNTKAILISSLIMTTPLTATAWGPEGHRLIGRAAYDLLDDTARLAVRDILGDPSAGELDEAIAEACNWPDKIRDRDEWRWSSPLHYVNIPRSTSHYDRQRDCRDGRCVTEGILDFADQLAYPELEREKRRQAFSFVCHLVADLHQPLHAGFGDDRGGNTVKVEYQGEDYNLHQVWDGVVIRERLDNEPALQARLARAGLEAATHDWHTSEVVQWTEESHAIAAEAAYPAGRLIDEGFANHIWAVTQEQWEKAAGRLARVLNAVLGENEVIPG